MHLSTPIERVSFFTVLLFLLVIVKAVPLSAGQYSNPLPTCERIIDQLIDLNKYWQGKVINNPILLERKCFENHTDLIQLHLQLVEEELRCTPPEGLSDGQQKKREDALGILRNYWEVKCFPINNHHPGEVVPYFIDDFGTACAVGHLIRKTGFETFAQRVQVENNYAYIEDMDYPELGDWAAQVGFSEMELRWIQPGYGCWANRSDIFVTNTNSEGVGSLAWAINEANSDLDPNTIRFNLSPGSVIYPTGQLWLDGTCDAIDGSLAVGEQIIIDGSDYIGMNWGIVVNGDECDVTNLIIRGYTSTALGVWGTSGVSLQNNILYGNQIGVQLANGSEGTSILFNTIGLDENGNNNQPITTEQYGIWVNDANNITINNNVIAGFNELDETGILLDGDSPGANFNICCNKIGTDASATQILPNYYGLWIGAVKSQITVFNNVFGANDDSGVVVNGANDVAIYDNYFGLNEQGQLLMPSDTTCIWIGGNASDVSIYSNQMTGNNISTWGISCQDISSITIGTNNENDQNEITNCQVGVSIKSNGTCDFGINTLSCNQLPLLFQAQDDIPTPVIANATNQSVQGTAPANTRIDVYIYNDSGCSNTPCQGKEYAGSTQTDNQGNWSLSGLSLPATTQVTAIATNGSSLSNYALCELVNGGISFCQGECYSFSCLLSPSASIQGETDGSCSFGNTSDYGCLDGLHGPEYVYHFYMNTEQDVYFDLNSSSELYVMVMDECSPNATCLDYFSSNEGGKVITIPEGGAYLVIDGTNIQGDTYTLSYNCSVQPPLASDCTPDPAFTNFYQNDAEVLAAIQMINDPAYASTIEIPNDLFDFYYDRLNAVFNAAEIPERDTVVECLNIHIFSNVSTKEVSVTVSLGTNWVEEITNGIFPTSNTSVNNLISQYGLTLNNYYQSAFDWSLSFIAEDNLNTQALANEFSLIQGVISTYPEVYYGGGTGIYIQNHTSYSDITYYIGWGDCLAGCIYGHEWMFRVFDDCSVQFLSSFGDGEEGGISCNSGFQCATDPLCLPWMQDTIGYYELLWNNPCNEPFSGTFLNIKEDISGNQIFSLENVPNVTDSGGARYYNCDGQFLGVSSTTIAGTTYNPEYLGNYGIVETIWSCGYAVCPELLGCSLSNQEISCLGWLNEIIVDLEANHCADFACTVVGGVLGFSSVKIYATEAGGEVIEVYWEECLEADRRLYSCEGELLASCTGLGCEITSLGNLTFQNDIWSCLTPLPDCDTSCYDPSISTGNPCPQVYIPVCGCNGLTYSNECSATESGVTETSPGECWVNCPTTSNDILCQEWLSDYVQSIITQGAYSIEISTAELGLNRFTVLTYNIIDNNYVDVFNCVGTLIQSCGGGFTPWTCTYTTPNFNLEFPEDYNNVVQIWNDDQSYPECPSDCIPIPTGMVNTSLCEGETYTDNGQTYTASGIYEVILPNASYLGCDSLVILQLNFINSSPGSISVTYCEEDIFYTYPENNQNYSEGIYDIILPGATIQGCDSMVTLTVLEETCITTCFQISASIIQPSCPGLNNGVITTSIFGGTPPYTYQWNTGSDSPNLSGLTPGEYTLTVTDASGCANSTLVGISQNEGDAVALPDGSGQSYESTISFSQFPAGATIQDVSDIVFVDLNMEHSYTGDLDIELICPDGTSIYLLDYPSGLGSTNFGEPYASAPVDGVSDDLTPGIPYTYTFVSNAAAGTIPQFDSNAPSYTYTTVPSEQTSLTYTYTDSYIPAGEYEPEESFTNLLGCPLNGDWTLRVTDNLNLDNGWLFGWSIGFANGPQTESITLEDQVCNDGTYLLTASSYSIEPGETITLNYTANPLGGDNLLGFGDGQSISLTNTTGSIEVTYDEPGVYRPSLRIDDQTVVRIAIQVRSCGWFGCVRGNNSYRESNEEICQLVTGDGRMYLPPSLSDRSYYWTSYENIRDFPVSGDAAILEARVKVPVSEGGISCYDPQIIIYGTDGVATARWMRPNCSYYSGIGAGSTYLAGSTTNLNALTADFNDWRILKIEVENQTIKAFIDDELRYTLAYEGTVGDVIGLRFYARGSSSIDWMRLYHANGTLVYEEEFSDCNLNDDEGCLVNHELTFIANPTVGQGGSTVQIPITVRGFENAAGFSYTLNLESNVGTITGITPAAISPISNPIDGQTTIVAWDDPAGQGLTLPDDEILFYLNVSLNTAMGLCGELIFTNTPLPISAFVWQNSNAIEVTVVTENAPVCTMIDGGETCDDPIPITCGQTLAANSEFGGDMEEVYSCLDNLLNGKEIYFQFENTQAQDVIFTLSGLTSDLELLLLDATCDPMACLRSSDRTGPVDEVIYWENIPVGTYYLIVEGYLEATSSFLLSVECGDIPGGTLSCQDEVLLCDAITGGNNENGSNNVLQYNCGQNDAYVSGPEYVYLIENQTTDSLIYVVTLQDHTADLDLFVLTGCNRNDCFIASTNSGTEEESFILRVNPQASYRVVIDGYNGAVSAYNLVVDCFPVNEFVDLNCDSSQPITCGEVINGNNVNGNYTGSSYCNGNYTNGPEDIYLFSNPYPQDVTILLSGLSQNLDVYLLDTCSVINSCVGIGDKSGISDEGIIIPNLPAGDYYIVVDGFDNGISDYQLELQCVPREVEKSGRITKVNGDAVQDVLVLCNDDMQTFSDAVGDYEFPPVLVGQDYIIEPHKDVNYRNGVGLIDIIRIRAHILGTTALPSNYHLIAADVSNDAQIDVLDISRLYQLYLFMIDDWPDVESWRFVPQEFEFDPIPATQDVPSFLESIALTALAAPAIEQDFYAIKMGDVTDDAAGDQIASPPSGFNRNYAVELRYLFNPSASLSEVLIPVYSTDPLTVIKGLQLELEAGSGLEILGIEGGKLPGTIHQNSISSDKVLIAWDHPQSEGSSMFSSAEEPLFYIRMGKEENNLWPDEVLNLTEIRMPAAVIDFDFEYRSVQLVPATLTTSDELYPGTSSLVLKARPNPFGDQVTIDFRLPSTSAVSLLLLDVSGQEIYRQTLDGKAGWGQVSFDRSLFPSSGVYFLKVCTNDAVQVLPLVCQ
jgi:subtilisin-like proprotein convertase family protein